MVMMTNEQRIIIIITQMTARILTAVMMCSDRVRDLLQLAGGLALMMLGLLAVGLVAIGPHRSQRPS
jgi:hypothetical protein